MGFYLNMVPHHDGYTWQQFQLKDLDKSLTIDETNLFLDISQEIHFDPELGLLGTASILT